MNETTFAMTPVWRLPLLAAVLVLASSASVFGQTETVIYTFQGQAGNDGYYPEFNPLVPDKAGNLYGTTTYGGGGPCISGVYAGCGFIYQLAPSSQPGAAWTETAIWRFQGGTDGGYPSVLLMAGGSVTWIRIQHPEWSSTAAVRSMASLM